MIYSPKKNTTYNFLFSLIMLAVFLAAIFVTDLFKLAPIVWQGVFFAEAIVFTQLATKYFLPVYTYSFDANSFIITKTMGKRSTVVCNIDTPRISGLYTSSEFKKQKEHNPKSVYNYNANMVSCSSYTLVFEYSSCSEAVVFEPSAEMAEAILAQIENQ